MEPSVPPAPGSHPVRTGTSGLAIASLVLGALALLTSFFLVGGILALVGIVLGVMHLRRDRRSAALAWTGVGLSAAGLAVSIGMIALLAFFWSLPRGGFTGSSDSKFASWVGREAPDIAITTMDGDSLRLSDFRGRRVVLDFWATWCPPCRMEIPHFNRLQAENSTNDLVIIGLSNEDRAVLKEFSRTEELNYLIASADGLDLPDPYAGVTAIPTTFFLDRSGRIQHVVVGYHDYENLREHALAPDLPIGVEPVPAQVDAPPEPELPASDK